MIGANEHIIHKVTLEIELQGKDKNSSEEIRRTAKDNTISALSKVFDKYDGISQIIRIPKLEMELGSFTTDEFLSLSKEILVKKLENTLAQITSGQADQVQPIGIERISMEDSLVRELINYLDTGVLPSSGRIRNHDDIEQVFQNLVSKGDKTLIDYIFNSIKERDFILRLIRNISQGSLDLILRNWIPVELGSKIKLTGKIIIELLETAKITSAPIYFDEYLYTFLFSEISINRVPDPSGFLMIILHHLTEKEATHSDLRALLGKILKQIDTSGKNEEELVVIKDVKIQITRLLNSKADSSLMKKEDFFGSKSEVDEKSEEPELKVKLPEDVLISNAGLILLYPYLNALFLDMNLIDNDGSFDPRAREKAVYLLHSAIYDDIMPTDELLVLNKILCGLEAGHVLKLRYSPTKDEKDELSRMLESAVNNWKALKSTSVAGFRDSFLLRSGVIKLQESSLTLLIERRGYDVLLDFLPYPFGMIKLPWMNKTLFVQW